MLLNIIALFWKRFEADEKWTGQREFAKNLDEET